MGRAENFRRAKSECVPKFPPGHWALAVWKIEAGAVPHLRLALPSQHARFNIRDTSSAPFGGTFP